MNGKEYQVKAMRTNDGFNECVKMLKENLKNIKEEAGV